MRYLVDRIIRDVLSLRNGDMSMLNNVSQDLTEVNQHLNWGWSITTFEKDHLVDIEIELAKWICSNSFSGNISVYSLREKLIRMDELLDNPPKMKPFNYYWNSIKHE